MKTKIAMLTLATTIALCAGALADDGEHPAPMRPGMEIGGDQNRGRIVVPPVIDIGHGLTVGGGVDYHLTPSPAQIDGGHINLELHF